MRLAATLVFVFTSCGARTDLTTSVTGSVTDGSAADAVTDAAATCDPSAEFGPPSPLVGINTDFDDFDVTLTSDERTAVFVSTRVSFPNSNLFIATRSSVGGSFSAPTLIDVADLGLGVPLARPQISDDLLRLTFDNGCVSIFEHVSALCSSTRAHASDSFANTHVVSVGAYQFGGSSYLLGNGLVIYFLGKQLPGLGFARGVRATTADNFGSVSPVVIDLGDVDAGSAQATSPVVTRDQLTLFFSTSITSGQPNDMLQVTRATSNEPFANPRWLNLRPPSATSISSSWISPDGCRLYFTQWTPTGDAGDAQGDLFVASRLK